MCLRYLVVQRNNFGQQVKVNYFEQLDIGIERQLLYTYIQQAQIQRVVTLLQQLVSNRQQQSVKTFQRKLQFVFFVVVGEEYRVQGYDFGYYYEYVEVVGNDGVDGGSY